MASAKIPVHAHVAVLVVTSPDGVDDIARAARMLGWECTVVIDPAHVAEVLPAIDPAVQARTP